MNKFSILPKKLTFDYQNITKKYIKKSNIRALIIKMLMAKKICLHLFKIPTFLLSLRTTYPFLGKKRLRRIYITD